MLRHLAEFPESRTTLRLKRRFGSYKRLLVTLCGRCNSRQLLNKNVLRYVWLVRLLLVSGCYYGAVDRYRHTPLHMVAHYTCIRTSKLLILMGASIDAKTIAARRPLTKAIEKQNLDLCKVFINSGANVNALNNYGWASMLQVAYNFKVKGSQIKGLLKAAGAL